MSNLRALVLKTTGSIPGTSIASAGLSLSLFVYEAYRMSSFQNVEMGGFAMNQTSMAALAVLVLLLFFYRIKPTFRLHRHPVTGLAIAGIYALSSLLLLGGGLWFEGASFSFVARLLKRICELLLLACWMEVLLPSKAHDVAVIFALSLFWLAGLNMLSAFLKESVARIFIAALPLLSMTCLYWSKDYSSSLGKYEPDKRADAFSLFRLDSSLLPPVDSKSIRVGLYLTFLLPLVCYTFVFGHIHYSWVPVQDGSFISFSVQIGAAVGTLLAGMALLFLVTYFWGRRKLELYNFFILPVVVLALYLTAMVDNQFSFAYVVPLNIAQKLAFFFIWISPYLIPTRKSPLVMWGMALSLYQFGKLLSSSALEVPDSLFYSTWVVVFVVVLIMGNATGVLLDRGKQALAHDAKLDAESSFSEEDSARIQASAKVRGGSAAGGVAKPRESPSTADSPSTIASFGRPTPERVDACGKIAKEYRLTRREEEILQLLSEGLTAEPIAETLVISASTAKSHMRNIYAKLDVHTHNEIILLVQRKQ